MTLIEELAAEAQVNMDDLRENPYPGRGIVVGLDETGKYLVQIYWIMGRSPNSRNRVFKSEGERVFTEAADPAQVKDPSLIIYNAMDVDSIDRHVFIVSNGHQTDAMVAYEGADIEGALAEFKYEPDAPNFTPRISALCYPKVSRPAAATINILRRSPWSDACECHTFRYEDIGAGYGYCVTTYTGDGDPLPSFYGEPLLMPVRGTFEQVTRTFWDALDENNRVSIAVKFIELGTGNTVLRILNQYKQVEQ